MGREPRAQQRSVTLAGVDVNLSINVFTISVDDVFALESAGIDREQLVSVDREKVDEALNVVELSESAVYELDESEYVRKAEVDEERKETRLQGLKDRLAVSDDPEAEVLRQEVERLEQEIEDLTEFSPGSAFGTQAESG